VLIKGYIHIFLKNLGKSISLRTTFNLSFFFPLLKEENSSSDGTAIKGQIASTCPELTIILNTIPLLNDFNIYKLKSKL